MLCCYTCSSFGFFIYLDFHKTGPKQDRTLQEQMLKKLRTVYMPKQKNFFFLTLIKLDVIVDLRKMVQMCVWQVPIPCGRTYQGFRLYSESCIL